jgi:hypothetical protein
LSEAGRTRERLEGVFFRDAQWKTLDAEERILERLGFLTREYMPVHRFPRFRELIQPGIIGQHLFEDLAGRGQTEHEIYRLSTDRVLGFSELVPYILELELGDQRKRFNEAYPAFFQFLDDLDDAWADRDRGIVTWVNQQPDPPAAVAARWGELAELGRSIEEGPGEVFLAGNALYLRAATLKYRWKQLAMSLFPRPRDAHTRVPESDKTVSRPQ